MRWTLLCGVTLAATWTLSGCVPEAHSPDPGVVVEEADPRPSKIDPVCGMTVSTASARTSSYSGKDFSFCSKTCAGKFRSQPSVYYARAKRLERERQERTLEAK